MAEGAGEKVSGGEDVYKVLVENVSDLIFLIDENLRVVSLNPAAAGIFGKRPEELVGKSVEELFPKEVAEGYVRSLKKVFATGCGVTADSVRVVGGRTSHLSSVLSPVKDSSGRVVRVIGVSRDVSVQKTVELALEESEERLKLLFEYAPDAYYLSDREGNFLDGNRAAEEMVGYKREELIGKNLLKVNLLSPEHLTNAVKLVAKSLLGQSTGPDELVLVRKDGSKVTVEIRTFPLKIAGKLTVLGIARDVAGRKKAEEEVRLAQKRLITVMETVLTGIVVIDAKTHKLIDANPVACELIGASKEQIVGSVCHKFICPAEDGKCPVTDLGGTVDKAERVLIRADGEKISIIKTVVPVEIDGRRCLVESFIDITDRKRAESELRENEERYRTLTESIQAIVYSADCNGVITYISPHVEHYGFKPSEVVSKNILSFMHPEDREKVQEEFTKVLTTGRVYPSIIRVLDAIGQVHWVEDLTRPLKDKEGQVVGVSGILVDVTDRIETEQTVRKLYKALDNTPDAVILADLAGKIQYANPALLRVGRFKDINEAVGSSVFDYADEAGAKLMREHVLPQLLSKGVWEGELVLKTKDGLTYPAEVVCSIVCDESGHPTNMLAIFRDVTERKAYELALTYSEKRFRDVVTVTTEYVWEMDVNGVSRYFSPGIEKILGYKPEEVVGKDIYFLWDPDERERLATESLEILKTGKPFKGFINVNIHKDGHKVILETSGVPMFDEDGKLIGYRGADRDVTERKAAEKALQESEERYRLLLQNANDAILVHEVKKDSPGRFLDVNERACALLGYSREELLNMGVSDIDVPEQGARIPEVLKKLFSEGHALFETEHLAKDGRRIPVEVSVKLFDFKGMQTVLSVVRDITERKRMQEVLRQSEERYRAMFESANDIIVTLDIGGRISSINRKIESITGYRREDIVGKHISELRMFPPDSIKAMLASFSQRAQGSSVPPYVVETIGSGGRQIFAEITGSNLMQEGRVVGLIVFIKDITDRRRAESALRESEEQHRLLFENAGVGIGYYTPGGIILGFNKLAVQHLGGRPEDYVGKSLTEVFGKEQGSVYMSRLSEAADSSGALEFEDKVNLPTGIKWFASTYTRVCGGDGKVKTIQIVSQDITDRRSAESALRVSEEKYRNIFENAIEGIFQSTPEGKYLNVNPAFAHMFGFESPQEMMSSVSNISTLYVYPSERSKVKELLAVDGFVKDYEAEMYHTDGRRIWISINAKAVKDKDGRILYYEGTTEDITNRKLDEERLRHINRQLMGIIDFLPDATFVVDKESKVFAWNRAMEELTGLSQEEAIGKGNDVYSKIFYGLQRPILIDSVFQTDSKILEKYSYVERRGYAVYAESFAPMLRNGAGAYLWIVASPLFDEQGNLIGAIETIRDITEKKKVDEEIRKLSKAVESSPNAVIVTDLAGKIEYVNDALPKVGRFSEKNEAIGRSVFEFAAGTEVDRLKNEIIPIILAKGQWSGEMLLSRSDHSTYFADMVCSAIPDERGRPKYLFATFHDISDRKNADENLKVTQRQQKALLDNIPDLVWLKDVERRFIAVNDAYGRMLNMKSEELVGKTELDVWPKALAEQFMADDAEVMSFGRRKSTEESVVDRHGRSRWMETIKTPIFDEGGSVVGTAGISRDTTERRNMEEELQEVNRRLNDTIEFFPDATFVIDREGKVLAWNRAIEEMTGVRKEEVVGKREFTYAMPFYGERRPILIDLVLKSDDEYLAKYSSITRKGDVMSGEVFAPKLFGGVGAYVSVTASQLKDEHGNIVGAIEAVRDITEKKKAAEDLKAKVDDLERFNKLMVGRELKMIELKREINSILDCLGEPPRYSVPVSEIKKLIAEEKDAGQKNGGGK